MDKHGVPVYFHMKKLPSKNLSFVVTNVKGTEVHEESKAGLDAQTHDLTASLFLGPRVDHLPISLTLESLVLWPAVPLVHK